MYSMPSIISQGDEIGMAYRTNEEKWNAYRILIGKPEGKRQLRRPIFKWTYNIKIDCRGIIWGSKNWIDVAQDRGWWRALVNTVLNLRVPYNAVKFLSSGLSRRDHHYRVA
jgi:hypothetical protein